jgi:hypothetical protein
MNDQCDRCSLVQMGSFTAGTDSAESARREIAAIEAQTNAPQAMRVKIPTPARAVGLIGETSIIEEQGRFEPKT